MIKNTLTNENNIQVFPTLGNHDTWPVDMENFSKANSIEPITELEDPWAEWIGEDNAKQFAEYGYFSMDFKLKDGTLAAPGAKVIALNT